MNSKMKVFSVVAAIIVAFLLFGCPSEDNSLKITGKDSVDVLKGSMDTLELSASNGAAPYAWTLDVKEEGKGAKTDLELSADTGAKVTVSVADGITTAGNVYTVTVKDNDDKTATYDITLMDVDYAMLVIGATIASTAGAVAAADDDDYAFTVSGTLEVDDVVTFTAAFPEGAFETLDATKLTWAEAEAFIGASVNGTFDATGATVTFVAQAGTAAMGEYTATYDASAHTEVGTTNPKAEFTLVE